MAALWAAISRACFNPAARTQAIRKAIAAEASRAKCEAQVGAIEADIAALTAEARRLDSVMEVRGQASRLGARAAPKAASLSVYLRTASSI